MSFIPFPSATYQDCRDTHSLASYNQWCNGFSSPQKVGIGDGSPSPQSHPGQEGGWWRCSQFHLCNRRPEQQLGEWSVRKERSSSECIREKLLPVKLAKPIKAGKHWKTVLPHETWQNGHSVALSVKLCYYKQSHKWLPALKSSGLQMNVLSPAEFQTPQTARDLIMPTRTATPFSLQFAALADWACWLYTQQSEISVWLHHSRKLNYNNQSWRLQAVRKVLVQMRTHNTFYICLAEP